MEHGSVILVITILSKYLAGLLAGSFGIRAGWGINKKSLELWSSLSYEQALM